jgi:acetyl-CoA carboxylase alpha subunit
MISYLEFEKPVAALEARIAELRAASEGEDVDISNELKRLEAKSADLLVSTYKALTPWQKTQVARHGRISATTSRCCSTISCRSGATAISARTRRSSAALPLCAGARSC